MHLTDRQLLLVKAPIFNVFFAIGAIIMGIQTIFIIHRHVMDVPLEWRILPCPRLHRRHLLIILIFIDWQEVVLILLEFTRWTLSWLGTTHCNS